jgi:hypothetical protein
VRRAVALCCSALGSVGCPFDDGYQRDRFEPATLAVTNTSGSPIEITSIYSVPEVQSAFILDEMSVAAGSTERVRITERTYEALVAGAFVVEGRCREGAPDWKAEGSKLRRESVRNASEWKVGLTLAACPPGQ